MQHRAESSLTVETAPRATLARRLLGRIGVGALLATAALAALGYWLAFDAFQAQELARLEDYVAEKGRTESRVFEGAEREAAAFAELFLEAYAAAPAGFGDDFGRFFRRDADGAWRTVPELHAGTWTDGGEYFHRVSGFISSLRGPGVSADLRRRLVVALRVLARLDPATDPDRVLHASFPENAIVIAADEPWGLTARHDLDMTGQSVIGATLPSANPDRAPVWTNLYFDLTAGAWAVTYQLPVDVDGRHVINPSNDVRLSDLMDHVLEERVPGSHNMILTADGAVVAHPEKLDEMQQQNGQIDLEELGDPRLMDRWRRLRDAGPIRAGQVTLVEDTEGGAHLAATRFHGPDWWWVTVYPRELLAADAHRAARVLALFGLLFFLLVMGVVWVFLRRMVAQPVATMTQAANTVREGDYQAVADGLLPLPEDRPDEVGLLARTFRRMARSLRGTRELDDALFLTDADGRILEVNPASTRLTGRDADQLLDATLFDLVAPADAGRLRDALDALGPDRSARLTVHYRDRQGDDGPVELGIRGFETPAGTRFLATARDISERVREHERRLQAERRSQEVQRYESLGQLAGGIAHDFNNLLATILGNAALAREELPDDSPAAGLLDEVTGAADRAGELAHQMLAYAGEGFTASRAVDLSDLSREALDDPDVAPDVELRTDLADDLPAVDADPSQLRQVVTSLLQNAREALGDEPGTITVRTYLRRYPDDELADDRTGTPVPAGEYVTLEVTDTGPGFDPDTAARLFDPFFSTKSMGRGLGLAALLGIVRTNNGAILAENRTGKGARFRVLLPPADQG